MENYIILIYGCDYGPNGKGLGEESKARIQKALAYIEKQSMNPAAIVLATGSPPDKNYLPLSFYMKRRLENHFFKKLLSSALYNAPLVIAAERQCLSTFEETVFANEVANFYDTKHIVTISSWYHLYRIALICNLVTSTKTIEVIPSWKTSSWLSPLLEPFKILKVFWDYYRYENRKKEKTSAKKSISPS